MHELMKIKQGKEKEFQSKICNENLKGARRLRDHLRIHTGNSYLNVVFVKKHFLRRAI